MSQKMNPAQISAWIIGQGLSLPADDFATGNIYWAMNTAFARDFGERIDVLIPRSKAPDPKLFEIGAERSGAGWKNPENFIITSAFVRLLGGEEQFELDVLKALFYYRPHGLLGHELDQMTDEAEVEVLLEEPEEVGEKEIYKKPPVWTWLRKHAENNVERAKIFKNVFDVDPIPRPYTMTHKNDWYKKRNAIAHGRHRIEMKLAEYVEAEVFTAKAMKYISDQCRDKLKLIV